MRIIVSVALAILFNIQSAHAVLSQPIVEIAADIYPGEVYRLGVNMTESGSVTQIYYENEKHEITYYDIRKLESGETILRKDNRDVVILSAVFDPITNTAPVKFKYLYNGIFGTYRSSNAILKMNTHTQRYELYDENGVRPLTSAYVSARYMRKLLIGISNIELK